MGLPKNNLLFGFEPKLTNEQRDYVDSIFDKQLTIINAKAGTGKTTLAVACAKIIGKPLTYIFAPVMENSMGFRPGDQSTKESIYHQPLIDALLEINDNPSQCIFNEEALAEMAMKKKVDIKRVMDSVWCFPMSHIFLRGTNLRDTTVIIDECQNFTVGELKKILTRVHDSCKVIMIGHSLQCDINPSKSGFAPYTEHFKNQEYCNVLSLTKNFRGQLASHADELTQ